MGQLELASPAFGAGQGIPRVYTCDGLDQSPPLVFRNPPAEARSLALLLEDPDAPGGTFVHWGVYDLPPHLDGLPEGVPQEPEVMGFKQGQNSFGRIGYGGPCPHRYYFHLYALDLPTLGLAPGVVAQEVWQRLQGHVLAEAEWMGRYQR